MPYRDPQKAREAAKLRMRKARAEKDLRKLQGRPGASQSAPPVPLGPSLSQLCEEFLGATREEWVNQKVALGLGWLKESQRLLQEGRGVESVKLGKAGMELVNAHLNLIKPPADGPRDQSARVQDAVFLRDPEYRELMRQVLLLRQKLQRKYQEEERTNRG